MRSRPFASQRLKKASVQHGVPCDLAALCERVLPLYSQHLVLAMTQSESAANALTQRFSALADKLRAIPELDGEGLEEELAELLLSLQFQDRVGQILAHVRHDMDKLATCLQGGLPLDTQRWLSELEETYTTDEQRALHHGLPLADSTSDVTFF